MTPFNSQKIITHKINETELSTFFVGFDINDTGEIQYRIKPLIEKLTHVIHEFAFGFHEGESTENTEILPKLIEAAQSIYKIDAFQKVKDLCQDGEGLGDDVEDKYLRRGEFGELILHLLLRDFYNTLPLLSKVYFKDSFGHTVHGFDAVHIDPNTKSLWLGESKLYKDGKAGIRALIKDIEEHFKSDYLNSEFLIISKKLKHFDNIPEKDYWVDLMNKSTKLVDQLESINIPLLCTYTCNLFTSHYDENSDSFVNEYIEEMRELKKYFDENNNHPLKTKLNIILVLFPVQNKIELVKGLHTKLSLMQQLGE
ncbi:HamA C-terminal domain-containing protein [Chryseobacterium sp. JK1]|uniref:HamA C-terminal domain-containing protein n=1 Tax=Chryseobacterium sp. JK1 TaxID=874294 RepID=UPI003D697E9E